MSVTTIQYICKHKTPKMNEINISAMLKKLMSSKKKLERDVEFFTDDALNINFNADVILINNKRIQASLECMTTAAHANIIEGPYDQQHYETIRKHLLYQNTENGDAREFWNYFSMECANVRAEQKGRTKELCLFTSDLQYVLQ